MKLPDSFWQHRPGMERLLATLDAGQAATRYVGGCVRDSLLDLPVNDVDLATRLEPNDVIARLERAGIKCVPTGLAHGTVTAVLEGGPVEITTLRCDVSTDGRRATVAFTDDWREDAGRRDFTINALSANPVTREVYDYYGGEADLAARRLRFIGDPMTRIAEDHLRILRFFRFHARFGKGAPDDAALRACVARANDLMALSRERIADELLKLLTLPDPVATIRLMVDHGILAPVLPEIGNGGVARLAEVVRREEAAHVSPEGLRRLAALLPPDPALAAAVAVRLRLSKKAVRRLSTAAARGASDGADPRSLAYRIGREEAVDRLLLGDEAPTAAAEKIAILRDWERPRFPLGGGELIAMGLEPGPTVATALRAIEQDWVERGFPPDPEMVRRLARSRIDQLLRARQ